MRRRNDVTFRFALLGRRFFERLFGGGLLRGNRFKRRLLLSCLMFELRHFRVQRPQLALHPQRARLVRAAAGDHAALIAGALRRYERILRIVARELFRSHGAVGQIGRAQPRQELLYRRPERIAEFHQLIETRNHAMLRAERDDRFVVVEPQIAQRIDEKCRAASDFIAQHAHAGASVIVRFHHHVLEFVPQILLDGGFVLLFDFGIVGQHAHRAKIFRSPPLGGGK